MEDILKIISDGKNRSVAEIAEQLGSDYGTVAAKVDFLQQKEIIPSIKNKKNGCDCTHDCCSSVKSCKHRLLGKF